MFIFDFGLIEIFEPEMIFSDLLPTFPEQGFLIVVDPLVVFLPDELPNSALFFSRLSLWSQSCRFQTLTIVLISEIVAFILGNFI